MTAGVIHNFSVSRAHATQLRLAAQIVQEDKLPNKINFVAGVDVAYASGLAVGAVAVLDYATLKLLEFQTAICKVRMPYIPTLLAFRELPPAIACIRKLKRYPDVFLVDGQGVAHPNRCGFASHLGLALGKPTIGVAKSRLIGKLVEVGDDVFLVDGGQIIGSVVTTKVGSQPLYVSVGHLVSLKTSVKIVKHCLRHHRIPEPLFLAHRIAFEQRCAVSKPSRE
ncbi:MAG: endonuclease V [Candidatus Bathyarchaeota archaeon]|nr:endonuclease V [Candidatus Bathyarchaeota archaeon]